MELRAPGLELLIKVLSASVTAFAVQRSFCLVAPPAEPNDLMLHVVSRW